MKLEDKVAIITGAASGIGKAAALLFSKEGAKIVVADIDSKGKETAEAIRKNNGNATFIKCDVSKISDVKNMVEQTVEKYGKIDVLFNNAGIYRMASIEEMGEEDWDKILDVNLKSAFLCSKYVIPIMKKQKGGAIINTASDLGIYPEPESPAYCASKAGLISLTKSTALAYGKYNIRVNAICPGPIDTPLLRDALGERVEEYVKKTLIGRLGRSEEVANVALFLASDDASYVNGAAYSVNAADSV